MDGDVAVALTAIDPETGYIKAMVGGKDFSTSSFNLATQAQRSCGSSFKMFTLIATLEEGISPYTSINCSSKVTIGNWSPENYAGIEYGTRSIRSAFAVSSNTAFARIITAIGPEKVVEVAHRLGIKSDLPIVPAITLGGEVTTLEMAGAVASVANGGIFHEPTGIIKVEDKDGNILYEADTTGERVLSPEIAHATAEIMKDVVNYGTGTAASLGTGQQVIGKTGTSEHHRDSYFIGATPHIAVAVWVGAPQERTISEAYRADEIFRSFVSRLLEGQEILDFPWAGDPPYGQFDISKLNVGKSHSADEDEDDEKEKETEEEKGSGGSASVSPSPIEKPEVPQDPEPVDPGNGGSPEPDPDPEPEPDPDPEGGGEGEP